MEPSRLMMPAVAAPLLLLLLAPGPAPAAPAGPDAPTPPAPAPAPAPAPGAETVPRPTPAAEAEAEAEAVAEAVAEAEAGRAAGGGSDRGLRALSNRLYDSCVRSDPFACMGLKAFYAVARFTGAPGALANVSAERARLREEEADRVLAARARWMLGDTARRARRLLLDEGDTAAADGEDGEDGDEEERTLSDETGMARRRRRRGWHILRKLLFPMLVGVVLKLGSVVPLMLGKLTIVGTMALMASKMSLVILVLMTLRRWLGGDGPGHAHMVDGGHYYPQHPQPAGHAGPPFPHGYDSHAYESQASPLAAPPDFGHGPMQGPIHPSMHPGVHPGVHPAMHHAVHPPLPHAPFRRVYRTYHVVRGRQLDAGAGARSRSGEPAAPPEQQTAVPESEPFEEDPTAATQIQQPQTEPPVEAEATEQPAPARSATSGFSVSREDVSSGARRLDEVVANLDVQ